QRAGISEEDIKGLKQAFKILFRKGLTISHALEEIKKEIAPSEPIAHLVKFVETSERGICR
ncbi:MAG: acyl-[acyl-carrier-protein]--UDP-N-acetylglucosamine O-acyltransferase, partial [Candidatus Omnitrophota bacterium]